ncbi:MAG: hypothetical protein K2M56_04385 [Muribaculaceae bacterium]|nr:hypothetical protein [Muribaculaceae bacterium]
MTREQLIEKMLHAVMQYAEGSDLFDSNPQLRINPATYEVEAVNGEDFLKELADNEETVEDETAADGAEDEDAMDWQAAQNPDFYSLKELVIKEPDGKMKPDKRAIDRLAAKYL